MTFLKDSFYGNTLGAWIVALLVLLGTLGGVWLLELLVRRRLRRFAQATATEVDDLVVELLEQTKFLLLLVIALWAASRPLTLPARVSGALEVAAVLAFLAQAGIWGGAAITFFIGRYRRGEIEADAATITTMTALGFVGRIVVWSLVLLLALENLGVDVTALIAGLGVGGIAVALAVQNILGDLFASLSIVLDRPFVIGDFLIIGEHMGSVEHIGLKTTRIRSLSGEQLVFSNADLLQSRIRNFGRMKERRVVFRVGVTYDTPPELAERIPSLLREVLGEEEQVRVDRCHFKELGDSALVFETVYYVEDPAYNVYADIQQRVNVGIMRRFEAEGIEFAYPTQTVVLPGTGGSGVGEEGARSGDGGARPAARA
ncbi:MAG: mechanosensitive ion channel family protein [bacterium]